MSGRSWSCWRILVANVRVVGVEFGEFVFVGVDIREDELFFVQVMSRFAERRGSSRAFRDSAYLTNGSRVRLS